MVQETKYIYHPHTPSITPEDKIKKHVETRTIGQLGKCLVCKYEGLSSVPRTCVVVEKKGGRKKEGKDEEEPEEEQKQEHAED